MTADALTVTPSRAELWVAYHRKAIISFGPVLLAGLNVLRDAAQTSNGLDWSTVLIAVFAAAQAVGTYLPDNAQAKLIASGVLAVAGGVTAAVTDGISSYSILLVVTQFIAWASAGAVENGPRPDVARAATRGDDGAYMLFPEGVEFNPDAEQNDRGDIDVLLILGVLTVLGVALLLFGVSFQ